MNIPPASFGISVNGNDMSYHVFYETKPNPKRGLKGKKRSNSSNALNYESAQISQSVLLAHVNKIIHTPQYSVRILLGTFIVTAVILLVPITISEFQIPSIVLSSIFLSVFILAIGLRNTVTSWKRDKKRKTVVIQYRLDASAKAQYERLRDGLSQLANSKMVWEVTSVFNADWKRNAGANSLIDRRQIRVGVLSAPNLQLNPPPYALSLNDSTLYFLPDCILMYQNRQYSSVNYLSLITPSVTLTEFREGGNIPSDTVVVGKTWEYIRKDGGADLRFSDNRQVSIVHYGQVDFGYIDGYFISLVVSNSNSARYFASSLAEYISYQAGQQSPFHDSPRQKSSQNYAHTKQSGNQQKKAESHQQSSAKANPHETKSNFKYEVPNSKQEYQEKEGSVTEPMDPYAVLRVSRSANGDQIKAAYRKLVKQYHPDLVANLAPEFKELADKKMKAINAAYDQLKREFDL